MALQKQLKWLNEVLADHILVELQYNICYILRKLMYICISILHSSRAFCRKKPYPAESEDWLLILKYGYRISIAYGPDPHLW